MKKIFVILTLLCFVPKLGSHLQDEKFFSQFVAPYVMIILDSSGSMTENMAGELCDGDGTVGGANTIDGHYIENPFYGRSPGKPRWQIRTWPRRDSTLIEDPDRYGDKSRLYIVKKAICQVLDEIGGDVRWGLATFYQQKNPEAHWTVNFYKGYYGHRDNQYVTPELQWNGAKTTYANEQFMLRVTISEAKGENESHINNIKKFMDSKVNSYEDQNEVRGSCWTPIAPALRGARYWYANEIKNLNSEEKWCRKYYVILLTDGEPTVGILQTDYGKKGDKAGLSGTDGSSPQWMKDQCYWEAESLRNTLVPAHGGHPATTFDIKTFVIGIGIATQTLDNIAIRGGTKHYYYAGSPEEVVKALRDILAQIIEEAHSFAAGEVTSIEEEFISTKYETRLYLASFYPSSGPFWEGHFRAIKLDSLSSINFDSIPSRFVVWNAGDLLRKRDPSTRNIYGIKNGSMIPFTASYITPADLGVFSTASRDTIINLVRGGSPTSTTTSYLGDIFHSSPLRIGTPNFFYHDDDFYKYRELMSKSRSAVIYAGSNTGMLHAFSDSTGEELFAVIPENLLPDLKTLKDSHRFYVDAEPMAADVWFPSSYDDDFKDATEWRTVLVASQGEGGRGMTFLDVTNPSSPSHLFSFYPALMDGNILGFTTSVPVIHKVKREILGDTVERFFAFFGGGEWPDSLNGKPLFNRYDPLSSDSLRGNVIVAVDVYDAATRGLSYGNNYWYIPPAPGDENKMLYPFAAAGSMINLNPKMDNCYDLLYIPDLAGQLWKVDVRSPDVSSWKARCIFKPPIPTKKADDTPSKVPSQPAFFHPIIHRDAIGFLWIFYGTGDRAKVFRKGVSNRFYAIIDSLGIGESYPLTEGDLKKVSPGGSFDVFKDFPGKKGWYILYDDYGRVDEKTVAAPIMFLDTLNFVTFSPSTTNDPCNPSGGLATEYSIHFRSGTGRMRNIGTGIPQSPKYHIGIDGEVIKIGQTSDSLWIERGRGVGALKRILRWKER
ncbi:MAG: PilC/PilY family type IV pilus protein [candidate division WOR-3 bacterium]